MRNAELISKFLNGAEDGKGSNLYIEGAKLINFATCIAERSGRYVILNGQHYSSTTKVHQNRIMRDCYYCLEVPKEDMFNNVTKALKSGDDKLVDNVILQLERMRDLSNMKPNDIYKNKKEIQSAYEYEVNQLKILLSGKAVY